MYGFYRTAAASPRLKVGDVKYNVGEILDCVVRAEAEEAAAVLFPEMSVCGYTCGDLFLQSRLLHQTRQAIAHIAEKSVAFKCVIIVGAPFLLNNALYNCAFIIHQGKVKGIVPKTYLPEYKEFYEKRWFTSGARVKTQSVDFEGNETFFGTGLVFGTGNFRFGVEICEDAWAVIPPSSWHCVAGALLTFNLSASNELVAKAEYRRELIKQQSARCMSAYVYASSGVHESTQDLVFGGHLMIAENGRICAENHRFERESNMIYADVDCERLIYSRISETSMNDMEIPENKAFQHVSLGVINHITEVKYCHIPAQPFVPQGRDDRDRRCEEIFNIQTAGLAKRYEHTGTGKAIIGISGGLDSTLALLVVMETFRRLGKAPEDVITVTMPGFGTTDRTYSNAVAMCRHLKTDLREIDIREACLTHFKDIGHDPGVHDVTYENVQARERTQILMDIANREGGLVIGTGDLSEIALGWSTYNGDHMSMYAVNCSVPKTLIRYLIRWVADHSEEELRLTLEDVIATPVSPELLPNAKDAEISQRTEDIIGPYELHDFFLYHCVKYGAAPEKIKYLAELAFDERYTGVQIKEYLKLFIRRFFSQQFKRSCIPDGPKVGTVSLSPRGDWRMPSDAAYTLWLDDV
ncbi:MAG: NAD(+) synthase [Victivallales bacterium]|nr:NAD(+) synthase [Victivallales bacterium]